jgi:diguanylate cyclase (GGDEF)-like protein
MQDDANPHIPHLSGAALDAFSDPVFATDAAGTIVYWSAAAERALGWPRELAIRDCCADLLAGLDPCGVAVCRPMCPFAQAVAEPTPPRSTSATEPESANCDPPPLEPHPDLAVARADGSRAALSVMAFPAILDGQRVLVHVLRDDSAGERDSLTGALTRAAFARRLAEEQHRAARHSRPLALVLVDVDHLQNVNDRGGHAAGDSALLAVASALREGRREDLVGRWGGDEFVVLMPDTQPDGALQHLQSVLASLRRRTLALGHETTFSAGVVALPVDQTLEVALRGADAHLYRAKRRGGRRVIA